MGSTLAGGTPSLSEGGNGHSKYGLHGSITTKVLDRGEKDHREDLRASLANTAQTGRPLLSVEKLADELALAKQDSFDTQFAFVPRDVLEEVMSLDQVSSIIPQLSCFQGQKSADYDQLARQICIGTTSKPPCRKLLAALIGMRLGNLIKHAMDDGMNDDCLPLRCNPRDRTFFLDCQAQGHTHRAFNKLTSLDDRSRLITWTRALTAPYIKQTQGTHFHYILEHGDHLPMQICGQVLENVDTNEVAVVTTDPALDAGTFMAHGGFGKVFKVMLHRGHWNFGGDNTGVSPDRLIKIRLVTDT